MSELYNSVLLSQQGNNAHLALLCKKFRPILLKYSSKLEYYDAYDELMIEFMNCIFKIPINNSVFINNDKIIIAYIKRSIINAYILLSKQMCKIRNNEQSFTDVEYTLPEKKNDYQFALLIIDISHILTAEEFKLFKLKYLYNYTDRELAEKANVSRQAITKRIKRIRNKLKKELF